MGQQKAFVPTAMNYFHGLNIDLDCVDTRELLICAEVILFLKSLVLLLLCVGLAGNYAIPYVFD